MCSTWGVDNTKDQNIQPITVRIANNAAPGSGNDLLQIQPVSGACGGTIHFGTNDLGSPSYVTADADFTNSKIQYNHNGTVTITLGGSPTPAPAAVTSLVTATYLPNASLVDPNGDSIGATPPATTASASQANF
jgi:hypothetical protein